MSKGGKIAVLIIIVVIIIAEGAAFVWLWQKKPKEGIENQLNTDVLIKPVPPALTTTTPAPKWGRTTSTADWKTYKSQYGFEMMYPADWKYVSALEFLQTEPMVSSVDGFPPLQREALMFESEGKSVIINVLQRTPNQSFDDVFTGGRKATTIISKETISVNGLDVTHLARKYTPEITGGEGGDIKSVFALNETQIVDLWYTVIHVPFEDSHLDEYNTMISTLKLSGN